ncbi:putative potassium transporter 11 [Tetrabaena socialis]|uniref:Putative potassium transporter 11 n=1 Tax=Tetrabaena socialis TaxID=47790 RepID=A0A2J7ZWG1_9CHLO|nr:putative potassium transporter 11 [Tetrabaena socialis]|eukprot:PNH04596.1 putative potassium transporter 11 [Tetrabaena socialis]
MGGMGVGLINAPVVALWLLANLAININTIVLYGGEVFQAINPAHIVTYFARNGAAGWRSLGAVMLSITGVEALYADLGHLSRGSISAATGLLAYPCLTITYLGQRVRVRHDMSPYMDPPAGNAAWIIHNPADTDVFWKSMPRSVGREAGGDEWMGGPLELLAAHNHTPSRISVDLTQATILGAMPPLKIVHTGGKDPAAVRQVYLPMVNIVLFVLCVAVVAGFQNTVTLGKAYGLAVMTTMLTTTFLIVLVMLVVWELGLPLLLLFSLPFLAMECAFWSANIIKPLLPPPNRSLRSASARAASGTNPPASHLLSRMSAWTLRRRVSGHGGSGNDAAHSPVAGASGAGGAAALVPGAAASSTPLPGTDRHSVRRQWSERAQSSGRAMAAVAMPRLTAVELSALPADTLVLEVPDPLSLLLEEEPAEEGDVEAAEAVPLKPLVVPLQRLRGIGVYYMDEKVGDIDAAGPSLPPVLVHFLRNVQAIHGVCVFLSVRRLALPSVPRRRRLHVYTSRNATAPNFYHVVSSYGYLDVIDHGPAFLTELLDAVLRRLKAVAAARRRQAAGGGGDGGGGGGDGGGGGGEYTARAESHHGDDQPRDMQQGQLVVRSLSHGAASSGGVGADSKAKSSVGSGGAGGGGGDGGGGAAPGDAAEGADGLLVAVETAAADFLEAQLHGVVYYASRAILRDPAARPRGSSLSRSRPGPGPLAAAWKGLASFCNWLLFGVLYRWLAAMAFVDMESWRVPPELLVELGMAVEM